MVRCQTESNEWIWKVFEGPIKFPTWAMVEGVTYLWKTSTSGPATRLLFGPDTTGTNVLSNEKTTPTALTVKHFILIREKKKISQNFQRQSQTEYLYNQFIWDMTWRKNTVLEWYWPVSVAPCSLKWFSIRVFSSPVRVRYANLIFWVSENAHLKQANWSYLNNTTNSNANTLNEAAELNIFTIKLSLYMLFIILHECDVNMWPTFSQCWLPLLFPGRRWPLSAGVSWRGFYHCSAALLASKMWNPHHIRNSTPISWTPARTVQSAETGGYCLNSKGPAVTQVI